MRLSAYVPLAIRTESVLDPAALTPQQEEAIRAIRVLLEYDIVQIGARFDRLKRIAFYGKDLPILEKSLIGRPLQDEGPLNATGLRLLHAITGLVTETAELAEALTHRDHGAPIDTVGLAEEIGDVQWYAAVLTDAVEADADRVLEANVAKLRERYPEKFDAERAVERNLDQERATLETSLATPSVDARLRTILRAMYAGVLPQDLPADLLSSAPVPSAMLAEVLSRSLNQALDAWIEEAVPQLMMSFSEEDLRLLGGQTERTDEQKARAKLFRVLGAFGLNARFNTLLETAVRAEAAQVAESMLQHSATGMIIPEG